VALGDLAKFTGAQSYLTSAPTGYNSTMGIGSLAPTKSVSLPLHENCKVPMGPCVKTGIHASLLHNEYIVYDTSQIKIRYLVNFEFEYK
jgi:poly [ADP-ribose] polymerase